ncbi:cation:proton antiporter [Microdochium nivale]|nr:cation:proton antiporter [Microdochium nivale]
MAAVEDIRGAASLPYHEPGISQILVMASFLLTLNGVGSAIDRVLYCGLIGQVLVGIAWGTPGAQWLATTLSSSTAAFEQVVVQLGYLGLILLVYEGGVSTSIAALKANIVLATAVAATGIAAPMGLSFVLGPLVHATPLQCFAAGAALCSTSLGTTFTVLSTSGLSATRLGSVLSTAAMMDDVIGLVMVQIVSSLGSSAGAETGTGSSSSSSSVAIEPATILRPVLVSVAFAVAIPLANRCLLRPAMRYLDDKEGGTFNQQQQQQQQQRQEGGIRKGTRAVCGILATRECALVIQTSLLLGLVSAAAYAGASVLLAAYLAGIMVCWWDAERESREQANSSPSPRRRQPSNTGAATAATDDGDDEPTQDVVSLTAARNKWSRKKPEHTGIAIYEHYYGPAVNRVLKPFFFASIGFSIPITKMFSGPAVWQGIIYTILMILGKVLCGLWLVRLPSRSGSSSSLSSAMDTVKSFFATRLGKTVAAVDGAVSPRDAAAAAAAAVTQGAADRDEIAMSPLPTPAALSASPPLVDPPPTSADNDQQQQKQSPTKPLSLYPAAIISSAMVARGEIGFLISAVAESQGVFSSSSSPQAPAAGPSSEGEPSEIFLVVTWAIVLCTITGPLALGILVRRVKGLEAQRHTDTSSGEATGTDGAPERHQDHVLGAWGV